MNSLKALTRRDPKTAKRLLPIRNRLSSPQSARISKDRCLGIEANHRFKSSECDLSSQWRREVQRGGGRLCQKTNWSARRQSGAIQIDIDTNPRPEPGPRVKGRAKCSRYLAPDKRSMRDRDRRGCNVYKQPEGARRSIRSGRNVDRAGDRGTFWNRVDLEVIRFWYFRETPDRRAIDAEWSMRPRPYGCLDRDLLCNAPWKWTTNRLPWLTDVNFRGHVIPWSECRASVSLLEVS